MKFVSIFAGGQGDQYLVIRVLFDIIFVVWDYDNVVLVQNPPTLTLYVLIINIILGEFQSVSIRVWCHGVCRRRYDGRTEAYSLFAQTDFTVIDESLPPPCGLPDSATWVDAWSRSSGPWEVN